jgi:lipoprotein-releasing system permease protein
MIAGTGVVNIKKDSTGKFVNRGDFLYRLPVSLTVMGVSSAGKLEFGGGHERNFWITDTSRTKVWQYDSNTVYVPFKVLQQDLGMDAQQAEQDDKPITLPARTSEIHIGVKEQYRHSSEALVAIRDKIKPIVERVLEQKAREGHPFSGTPPTVRTWEESQAKWMGAIEKEMVLVTGLFGMISVVAVFLIFCIFYMIVVEKTRDIGIIKSVGATSSGVAGIFLGYGAAIGIVGSALGLLCGYLIVHNINTLHAWLGRALGVVIWDPEVYAFDTIPNTLEPKRIFWILVIAVLASIIGALVPAIRAARLNPVEALRWE